MSATERATDGLAACLRGEVPVSRRIGGGETGNRSRGWPGPWHWSYRIRSEIRRKLVLIEMSCKTDTRRSSATAPALLYLLHPCSRAHPCARGIPFILNIKKSGWDNLPWYPWPLCGRVATRQLLPCLSKSSTSLCFRRSFC
jgi:hypothetical protein